ncbi:MAG: hypothetical protein COU33_04030 [Candidatus Magasanikbacteria bacterium CG10_big_fil_rev_8_21_14_0_10_43_6]|uniref:Amino acid aminotransferase n=1 Tax=Candidatus Magasanikbacteria bacterium CG10_big_fil_rev_8_21_14_0_10_43_6 TaxID=1974650 RepID=A0A2M6W0J8_9BACT|nr:MAG: hypothetical protein COU33_04030 [Candidatus Magasanikbacteria bacterium CG10_big_fil_rev_8_21_14_0_10_43_6]
MDAKFVSINGKIVARSEAVLPVDHIEFTYGFGVYENIRLRNGALYFTKAHIERLLHSAQVIGLAHPFSFEHIQQWIVELVKKNSIKSSNIKILLVGGAEPLLYILSLAPRFVEKKIYKTGVKAISAQYERFLPQAKTLNMLPSYILYKKATQAGAYDTILYDNECFMHEGTRSNIFFVKNDTLYTPPAEKILLGVTRHGVIECAKKHDIKVNETHIPFAGIKEYDGAFFTNTSGKIVPIRVIDEFEFNGVCELIQTLIPLFNEYIEKNAEPVLNVQL